MGFVHLHLHSEYSLLDGACRINEIAKKAAECGMDSVAITDHGVMYGTFAFYEACVKEGIKPIIGCECYVTDASMADRNHTERRRHLVLLCKNEIGYKNLSYIVSKSFTEGFYSKPRIDLELLSSHSEGLIALSGCLSGRIPSELLAGNVSGAEKYAEKLKQIFGDDFYIEIQNHGLSDELEVMWQLADLAKRLSVKTVATNDVHYLSKKDAKAQEVLMCVQTNTVYGSKEAMTLGSEEFYFKSESEMLVAFEGLEEAVYNTAEVAEKCDFAFKTDRIIPPRLPREICSDTAFELRRKVYEGLEEGERNGRIVYDKFSRSDYEARIERELDCIGKMGYNDYFLIVGDYVGYAKSHGIPVGPGRGSGAGSLCVYLLGITDADPLKFDLLFERFLNPERVSMPDIDVDFCYIRRDEVINYVIERYGRDNVAQIITFGTLAAKAAVRDVGRALNMPYADVDRLAKMIPATPGIALRDVVKRSDISRLCDEDDRYRELIDLALSIEGMPRNVSVHAAGVLISDRPVYEYLPLAKSGDVLITQFDMDAVSRLGLLKYDFLALRYLTVIADAEREIKRRIPNFNIERVPFDDKAAYDLISRGDTLGVFQLESHGMRRMLCNLMPSSIEDITAAIALYRPGPMESIPQYISARNDPSSVEYLSPKLKPILESTHGCIVYQEQVMSIFRELAGYTLGRADIVRRAMSKKKLDVILAEKETFINGAEERGEDREVAAKIFDRIEAFANYAFNKSHSVPYAMIAYRTAYLKANFPAEFCSALLTSVLSNPAKVAEYIDDFSRFKIKLLPPDINESLCDFSVSGNDIRFGLVAIRAVGRLPAAAIIEERKRGSFTSFTDFLERMPKNMFNKRTVEALIRSGAFDSLGVYRSRLIAVYEDLMEQISRERAGGIEGQMDLFSSSVGGDIGSFEVKYPNLPEYDTRTKLSFEKEYLGLYVSGHLTDDYSKNIDAIGHMPIFSIFPSDNDGDETNEDTPAVSDGDYVNICGVITSVALKKTKAGADMAFFTLEDRTGDIECIAFESIYKKFADIITVGRVIFVRGRYSARDDEQGKIIPSLIKELVPNSVYSSSMSSDHSEYSEYSLGYTQKRRSTAKAAKISDTPVTSENTTVSNSVKKPKDRINKVYVRLDSLKSPIAERLLAVADVCPGDTELILYDKSEGKYVAYSHGMNTSDFVLSLIMTFIPKEDVVLK